jgi:hypothetical protein
MHKITIISVILLTITFFGCGEKNHFHKDLDKLPDVELDIRRYETALFELNREQFHQDIEKLQKEFPIFLNGDIGDSAALDNLWGFFEDKYNQEVYKYVKQDYADLSSFDEDLEDAFKYMSYYFPEIEIPSVYTYISGMDFQFPIKFTGRDLIVSLDLYTPSAIEIYAQSGVPKYHLRRMVPQRIVPDVMNELSHAFIQPTSPTPKLIEKMIYEGKKLYFVHAMMPELQDSILMNYSAEQMGWCYHHEAKVWAFIMESDFLYETKVPIHNKFMKDGPFTAIFNKQSPSRIGAYIGYKIVLNYMMENDVDLGELCAEDDYQKILQSSAYHPE